MTNLAYLLVDGGLDTDSEIPSRVEEEHSPEKREPGEAGEVYVYQRQDRRTPWQREKARFKRLVLHGSPKPWGWPVAIPTRLLLRLNREDWRDIGCILGTIGGAYLLLVLILAVCHV